MQQTFMLSETIQKKLAELGVIAVYLFGSFAEGTNTNQSDSDIGILMHDPTVVSSSISTHPLYHQLYTLLEPIFSTVASEIDIVFLQRSSLELQAHAVLRGKILFDANPAKRLDFEEKTIMLYADFAPLRYEFDQAVLAKI